MARQSTTPVEFNQTVRPDTAITMSSARAGVVVPAGFIPLFAGDSCSGRVGIDIHLKEMPKPLLNAVFANVQAWFYPKSASPRFSSRQELMHARTGEVIKALGATDRAPPSYFYTITGGAKTTFVASDFAKTLGLHIPSGKDLNSDVLDAFVGVYNFRLAAHSSRLPIGFVERHATDAANLDDSVTLGGASAVLSLNVPRTEVDGVIIFTIEVLPERIDERMSDEWLQAIDESELPNALRDVQRVEPVDIVPNRRIDAKHATPNGMYGYEPMNYKWRRDFTRLGGDFYQATPGAGWTENRSAIWQTEIVNPVFGTSHYLAPAPFPHKVFADQVGQSNPKDSP